MSDLRPGARDEPLVSVIIPAFNHEPFVKACLDSVVADEYPPKEVVVADDGSTDGTLAVIEAWAASHAGVIPIRVVSHPNMGLARTLNRLLRLARGEYVIPLASDDYLLPGRIQPRVAALEADRTVHALWSDCIVVDESGELLYESGLFGFFRARREWLISRLAVEIITNWSAAGAVLIYRREAVLGIGGYSEDLLVEDWDLYLRLVARGWLKFMDGKVSAYRLHSTSVHTNSATRRRQIDDMRRVALRSAHLFRGRQRSLLILKAVSLFLELQGDGSRTPSRFVWRAVRRVGRVVRSLLLLG